MTDDSKNDSNAESDRQMAMRVLRDTLRDGQAKATDRVRAAQLMLEHDTLRGADDDALSASDAELLAIARAPEGGYPPLMGPNGTPPVSVPSRATGDAPTNSSAPIAVGKAPHATSAQPDDLGRVPAAFLVRGPKTDPSILSTPGGKSPMGPKKDPSNLTPAPSVLQDAPVDSPNNPNPWE